MNSFKTRLAMSAVIAALSTGAVAAHADAGITQPSGAESPQFANFEHQLSMGSVASYMPAELGGGAVPAAPASDQPSPIGIFHRADSSPVRSVSTTLRAIARRPAVSPSPFDNPLNTASPGG
jgi:hypothetical protein